MIGLILKQEGFTIEATTGCCVEGLRLFQEHQPKLVISSLNRQKHLNSIEMIRRMRLRDSSVQVLVFSGIHDRESIFTALALQANGFVHKTESLDLLRHAVGVVAQGSSFFSPYVSKLCEGAHLSTTENTKLAPKELLVLQSVAEGLSTKQIAERLFLSPKTVENYRGKLMKKLGQKNAVTLTRYALGTGLVCVASRSPSD